MCHALCLNKATLRSQATGSLTDNSHKCPRLSRQAGNQAVLFLEMPARSPGLQTLRALGMLQDGYRTAATQHSAYDVNPLSPVGTPGVAYSPTGGPDTGERPAAALTGWRSSATASRPGCRLVPALACVRGIQSCPKHVGCGSRVEVSALCQQQGWTLSLLFAVLH